MIFILVCLCLHDLNLCMNFNRNERSFESLSVTKNFHKEDDYERQCCETVVSCENKTFRELSDEQTRDTRRPPVTPDSVTGLSETVANQNNEIDQIFNECLRHMNKDQVSDHDTGGKEESLRQCKSEFYQAKKELKCSINSAEGLTKSDPPRQLLVNSLVVLLSQWSTQSTLEYLHLVKAGSQGCHSKEKQGTVHDVFCLIPA